MIGMSPHLQTKSWGVDEETISTQSRIAKARSAKTSLALLLRLKTRAKCLKQLAREQRPTTDQNRTCECSIEEGPQRTNKCKCETMAESARHVGGLVITPYALVGW